MAHTLPASRPGRARRLLRTVLWTDVPEPVGPEDYRRLFRLLVFVCPVLAAMNVVGRWALGTGNVEVWDRFLALNLPAHAIIVLLGLFVTPRMRSVRGLRVVAVVVMLLLLWASFVGNWLVETFLAVFLASAVIAVGRAYFDAAFGLATLGTSIAMAFGLQALRWAHLVDTSAYYSNRMTHSIEATSAGYSLAWQLVLMVMVYCLTSYVVNRFRRLARAYRAEHEARQAIAATIAGDGAGRLSGTVLGDRYEVGELLGRGAMGEVYAARRIADDQTVAVKVLHSPLSDVPVMRERFQREAEALGRLGARHVASVHELVASGAEHFIVMDRLLGEDLANLLRRRGVLPLPIACALTDAIAKALDAAHGAGIVHRDLKPQNIFLLDAGTLQGHEESWTFEVRLLDFGVARLLDDGAAELTCTDVVLGTPGYLAPEQVRGVAELLGPHTDVFELGAIVYRMLTGVNAFPSRNPAGAIFEALNRIPPPPSQVRPELPTDVDHVVALALAKEVRHRYGRASELAADLRRAASGELAEATRARAQRLPRAGATLLEAGAASSADSALSRPGRGERRGALP